MDGMAVVDAKSANPQGANPNGANAQGVGAALNFIEPMKEKPYSYNCEPPPGVPARNTREETHTVTVHDARPLNDRLSLDREGFVLVRQPTEATDLYDEAQITKIYYPECEQLIREHTGAKRVVAFDHIVRNAARMAKGNQIKGYAGRVHNDYTAKSAPQRVRDIMGAEAEELLGRRYAEINVWRPIRGPLLRSPLALCDAQTLAEENLVASDLRYPDRTGETYAVTYNPAQRWYYFPRMMPEEAVLIRCFDSARTGAARFSAHGAFDDPNTPEDAPPRESIETRALVFFAN